jgi:hypothetical protein
MKNVFKSLEVKEEDGILKAGAKGGAQGLVGGLIFIGGLAIVGVISSKLKSKKDEA